jgi:hypothetical protein
VNDWLAKTRDKKKNRTDTHFLMAALANCEAFQRFQEDTRGGSAAVGHRKPLCRIRVGDTLPLSVGDPSVLCDLPLQS